MAGGGWLERFRHRPPGAPPAPGSAPRASSGADPAGTPPSRSDLLEALRADPGATDLRPVIKSMSRTVSGWMLGHPAVRTAEDAWNLKSAMLAAPDFPELVEARITAQCALLAEALAQGDEVPPIYLFLRLDEIDAGRADDFLASLPPESVVQLEVAALREQPDLCRRVADRVRAAGVRIGITGLQGVEAEVEVARSVEPHVLLLDARPPMDYRDRLPVVRRLRETMSAPGRLVMCNVTGPVDEWAGTVCGAELLAGTYYDNADFSTPGALAGHATGDEHRTPFEMAAERHPTQIAEISDVVEVAGAVVADACRAEGRADVYVLHGARGRLAPAVAGLITGMRDCEAAVTVLAPSFDGLDCTGIACAQVDPGDPLARGWTLVALLPDGCQVVAAVDAPAPDERPGRWQSYVAARDRDLAVRIASRVSERVGRHPR